MTPFSRPVQSILDAVFDAPWESGELDLVDVETIVAAAFRAAALQCSRDRLILLAMAEELEGTDA
jgi:hypothetical protein